VRRIVICAAVVAAGVTIIAAGGHRDARVATVKAANAVLRTPATVVPTTTTVAPTIRHRRAAPVKAGPRPKPTKLTKTKAKPKPTTPVTVDPAQLAFLRARALNACLATAGANHGAVVGANDTWHRQQLHRLAAIHPRPNAQYEELQIQEQQAQLEIQAEYTIDVSNCYLKYP
jgi:hypothetical protein